MQPGAEGQPRGTAGFGIEPDQAHGAGSVTVPDGWLDEFADSRENLELDWAMADLRRKERLREDAELVAWLALNRFAGRDYERFEFELARYGYAVILVWIRRGQILGRCRERGLGGLPEAPACTLTQPGVAQELANETVAKALHYFRTNVLVRGKWDPTKGASIKTYFIGQCLIQFPNVYRYWLSHEAVINDIPVDDLVAVVGDRPATPYTDPLELTVIRDEIDRRFATAPERVRTIMVLVAAGWSQQEIATELGTTVKTVERALAYFRTTVRKGIAA